MMSKLKHIKFAVDDIVFAKLHRYPYWPAKIISVVRNRSRIRYNVTFFGPCHGTGMVNENNVRSYQENKVLYGIPKVDNFKNASFNAALKEVDIYLTSSNTDRCAEQGAKSYDEIVEDDVFSSECDFNRTSSERNYQNSTPADSAYDDNTYQGLQGSAEDLVFSYEPHSNTSCRDLSILDHYEEHTILDNVAEKLQRYDNLEEIDIETSLALAAEVGNALLSNNNEMKVELTRSSGENKRLSALLREEQKKNESLTRRMNEVLSNQSEYCSELEETLAINEQIIGELTEKNISSCREITYLKNKLNTEQTVKDDLLEQYESDKHFFTTRIKELESENSSLKMKIGLDRTSSDNELEMEIVDLKGKIDNMIKNEKIIKDELDAKNQMIESVTLKQIEFLDKMSELENFLESLLENIKNILKIEDPIPISDRNSEKCVENRSCTISIAEEIPNNAMKNDELFKDQSDQIFVKDSIDFIRNKVVDDKAFKRRPICAYKLKDGESLEDFFRSKCEKYLSTDENNITVSACNEEPLTDNTKNTMACYDRGWSEHPSSALASSSSSMLLKMIQAQAQEEQRRRIQTQEEMQRRAYHDTWSPWESLAPVPSPPSPAPVPQSLWGNDVWAPPPPPDTWAPPGLAPRPPPRLDDPANPDMDIGLDYDPFRSLSNIWAPHSSPNNFWKPPTTN